MIEADGYAVIGGEEYEYLEDRDGAKIYFPLTGEGSLESYDDDDFDEVITNGTWIETKFNVVRIESDGRYYTVRLLENFRGECFVATETTLTPVADGYQLTALDGRELVAALDGWNEV